MDGFSLLPFNCFLLRSSCEGCRVFPPNCSARTPTDTLMTTALCASPAARMRRGRDVWVCDEGLWGGAHISFPLVLFLCGQGGQTPAAPHTHTQPHPAALQRNLFVLCVFISRAGISFGAGLVSISFPDVSFSFAALTLPMERRECRHVFLASLAPTHKKSDCALRAALTRR
ncbi:hypothetical protein BCY84_05074 [Trypanosoma cruzi cruzi]|nr:hypothetical protein BCY84_05074 [Trypanosoma cruzi cruzi]